MESKKNKDPSIIQWIIALSLLVVLVLYLRLEDDPSLDTEIILVMGAVISTVIHRFNIVKIADLFELRRAINKNQEDLKEVSMKISQMQAFLQSQSQTSSSNAYIQVIIAPPSANATNPVEEYKI